ncbi:HET-domain-containing protein [Polyporus arcularius HHB13444]|uniref:HET-domain-containing protein n=1 Tax=Polyporus arcularius HHB13444 TaxID=1314778 RepID=A0A5C3P0T3_9APHY|nr:HET-domain-containing protein [Polyporus arcularius HHB13444]
MWFLRTDRAELVYHSSSEGIVYAILSHVWGPSEQSFQDIQELHRRCSRFSHPTPNSASAAGENPRSHADAKIRNFCIYAEAAGYEWVWVDTCCIDKSSSAELSEAINSMFTYYANADVCYAFLEDVPDDDDPERIGSAFRQSRWFTRGWTLQELIAPIDVVFLSQNWMPLCSKCAAPGLVREVTGIDIDVLLSSVPLSSISAAKRLSWASQRETRRIEDEAYSLMGIFGVNIPIMYGEGRRAFRRLQEEIMKQSPDHTLFVWRLGQSVSIADLHAHAPWTNYPRKAVHAETDPATQVLFAPAPQAFHGSREVQSMSVRQLGVAAQISLAALNMTQPTASALEAVLSPPHEVPEFAVTSYGVRARLPVIRISDDDTSIAVAVLACQGSEGCVIGLLLHEQENVGGMPLYRVGVHTVYNDIGRPYPLYGSARYVRIHLSAHYEQPVQKRDRHFVLSWQVIYIVYHTHSFGFGDLRGMSTPVASRSLLAPCRLFFPPYMLARLGRLGFTPDRPLSESQQGGLSVLPHEALEVMFTHERTKAAFSLRVACCLRPAVSLPNAGRDETSPRQPLRHIWATVDASWNKRGSSGEAVTSGRQCYWCREVHLEQWTALDPQLGRTGRQMVFPFAGRTLTLTFSQWDVRSRTTGAEAGGGGGGLFAVDIEVEEQPATEHAPENPERASRADRFLKGDANPTSRRSSLVRSMLAAVHQQVRGKR